MKILLVGINAKYIHSNPAVYSLRASAVKENVQIEIAEYTINQTVEKVIQSIYKARPDMICISCYIWNVTMVQKIVAELHKLCRGVPVWLGGPEVSFDLEWQMQRFPTLTGIMYGEGEGTFPKLIDAYVEGKYDAAYGSISSRGAAGSVKERLQGIRGIAYRDTQDRMMRNGMSNNDLAPADHREPNNDLAPADGRGLSDHVTINEPAEIMDLNELPFPYDNIEDFQNRIIYYETSRGCPYSCAYCLSSVEKKLRYRSLDKVFAELQIFLDARVKQVKFVDRTFNCNHAHAAAILTYIKEHDNGVTNFHFEVAGDLLTEEEMALIGSLRPGLVQLEIGVQSTNEKTLEAIRRKTDLDLLRNNIRTLLQNGNVHLHLDLIAGLPYENITSFIHSFNEVYQMGGHELQLGFLKLLHGTPIMRMKEEHAIVCTEYPPYEVLHTKELAYDDILQLKAVEEMLEIYHNSGQFCVTERFLVPMFSSPFAFYEKLAEYYEEHHYPVICSARERRYEILLECAEKYLREKEDAFFRKFASERLEKEVDISFQKYALGDNEDVEKNQKGQKENDQKIMETLRELLTVDYYLRERAKARPSFAPDEKTQYRKLSELNIEIAADRVMGYREWVRTVCRKYAEDQDGETCQPEGRMHVEILYHAAVIPDIPLPQIVLFDYRDRDSVTKAARMIAAKMKSPFC